MSKNLRVSIKYWEVLGPRITAFLTITNKGILPTDEVLMPVTVKDDSTGKVEKLTVEEIVNIVRVGEGTWCASWTNRIDRTFQTPHEAELWIERILQELDIQYKKWTKRDRLIAPKDRMVVIKP